MTHAVIRRSVYFAIIIIAGAAWWFGGIGRFKDVMEYVLGISGRREVTIAPPSPPQQVEPKPQALNGGNQPTYIPPLNLPPRPLLPRPPAETANPQYAKAQEFEAKGMLDYAWLAYDNARKRGGPTTPYYEDSLMGIARISGQQKDTAAVCAALDLLRKEFPAPRADLVAQITAGRRESDCGP